MSERKQSSSPTLTNQQLQKRLQRERYLMLTITVLFSIGGVLLFTGAGKGWSIGLMIPGILVFYVAIFGAYTDSLKQQKLLRDLDKRETDD